MNRTALVSGTSSGIGEAIAGSFLQHGFTVLGLARRKGAIEHPRFHHIPADLSDLDALPSLVDYLFQQHAIDLLICNAGAGHIGTLETFNARQIARSLELNLVSPLILSRSCIPHFRKRSRSDIVFLGSESALEGKRQGSLYSAAKFGLRGAAQALRDELAGSNCHVGIVHPGMVRTAFFDTLSFEPGPEASHALEAGDVADAILQMISAPAHAIIEEIVLKPRQHVVQKR